MPEPLQDRFDVTVEGDTYTFRIPTIKHDIEVGYRAAEIRQKAYPEGMGAISGLDYVSSQFSRYCAEIELYLVRSTTLWPYGFSTEDLSQVDFNKPPKVDFEKFPFERADDVYRVGQAFEAEVSRFRSRRNTDNASAGAQAVDSVGGAGAS